MRNRQSVDICIIGGGIYGLATAYHLAKAGRDVLVVERGFVGMEASTSNAGSVGVQNKTLKMLPLTLKAANRWEKLSEELGVDVGYNRIGGLRVAHTEEDVTKLQSQIAKRQAAGVPLEFISGEALCKEAPYLSDGIKAATYCHLDGLADPFKSVFAYLEAFERLGGAILTHSAVKRIITEGKQVIVETPQRRITANKVVNTAGAWAGAISAMMGLGLPITWVVNMVLVTEPKPLSLPHTVTHVQENLSLKEHHGRIVIGGAWRGDGDPYTGRKQVTLSNLKGHMAWACNTLPALRQFKILRSWVGFQGQSPDRLFVMGELPPYDGKFYILAGGSGGFTLAPALAELMAEWILCGSVTDKENGELFDVRRYCDRKEKEDVTDKSKLESAPSGAIMR
jgi:sarcosine oxidase subunit beta